MNAILQEVATKVRDMLAKDNNTKDDLAISFAQDMRSVSIKFRKQILPAKVRFFRPILYA